MITTKDFIFKLAEEIIGTRFQMQVDDAGGTSVLYRFNNSPTSGEAEGEVFHDRDFNWTNFNGLNAVIET